MVGLLHAHSENSLKECPVLIRDLIDTAKEKGYCAVALTDHGSMTGTAEFINTAIEKGVKPVPGLELDIAYPDGTYELILMAKDHMGYVGLCKAVSEANRTLSDGVPVLDADFLAKFFGIGAPYHGHVAASSGGIRGRLCKKACLRLENRIRQKTALEAMKNAEEAEARLPKVEDAIAKAQEEIRSLETERKKASSRAGKNFSKKEEMAGKLTGAEREAALKKISLEKEDSKNADAEVEKLRDKISRRRKKLSELEKQKAELRMVILKKRPAGEKPCVDKISLQDDDIAKVVAAEAMAYQEIFGKGGFFIELMSHGRREEAEALPILSMASQISGIGTFLSNDVHILHNSEEDVLRWQLLRSLEGNHWSEMDPSASFYDLKDESSLVDMFTGLIPDSVIENSLSLMHSFFDSCSFEWPKEKHYPKYTDPMGRTPDEALAEEVRMNIKKRFKQEEWTDEYESRLQHELPVIQKTGYSDYTLILSDILKEGRKGKHEKLPGSFIGPGRGSGAGSLVNYLMGITNIDPLKYGLIFERYLNIERISPPDIDSDIATSVRDLLIQYIVKNYSSKPGRIGVCGIITKSRLTAKAAVRAAGRVLSSKLYGNAAKLYQVADRISKAVPNELHMSLGKCRDTLRSEFHDDTELEIIHYAELLEGLLFGYGTHAAGVIITDNGDVTEYAPIRNMGTNEAPVWNIQYDKEESEAIGLLKLDALGLTSLDIISNTLQRIYRKTGRWIDINKIPFEKKVFTEIYGKGRTNGVFQCESPGMKRLWMQMKPDRIEDIIAGVALYRPGPMDFIPDYIKGKKNPRNIQYLAPQLKPILEGTYGCIVYQEQVMRIVRDLAGYSMGRSDLVRRAMAKKKASIMDAERKNFVYGNKEEGIPGCASKGIPAETAEKIYDMMVDFAKYAFNKSHAAAYAIVSYQTAWLKYYYPKEFLIETLNLAPADNIPMFIEECRKYGYEVSPPDINRSCEGFSESDGKILYGIGSVKGVRSNALGIIKARRNGFAGFSQFILSGCANKAVTKALIKAGAFSMFCKSRTGLLSITDTLAEKAARVRLLERRCAEKKDALKKGGNKKIMDRTALSLRGDEAELRKLTEEINGYPLPSDNMDPETERAAVLKMEKETLFTYISAHPLDQYGAIRSDPISSLSALEYPCEMRIFGAISGFKKILTKTNKEMCLFDIEDKTGKARAVCWPETYARFREALKDGAVIIMDADVKQDGRDGVGWTLFPRKIALPESRARETVIEAKDQAEWGDILDKETRKFETKQGSRLLVFFRDNGKILVTDRFVTDGILESGLPCGLARRRLGIKKKGGNGAPTP